MKVTFITSLRGGALELRGALLAEGGDAFGGVGAGEAEELQAE